ncbi:MAG TPA: hypothetical protein VMG12_29965, partial [Polyangiaceae bacterium]|nr:hypothetical protein [Polyangiaceae bacterium]
EPPCTGCLQITQPFTATSQNAFFNVLLADGGEDFSDAVVHFLLRAPAFDASGQIFVQPFVQDNDFAPFVAGSFLPITADTFEDNDTFVEIDIDVGAVTTVGFDATTTRVIGFQIIAGGSLPVPATQVLLLDSITFDDAPIPDFEFTDDEEGFEINEDAGGLTTGTVEHL